MERDRAKKRTKRSLMKKCPKFCKTFTVLLALATTSAAAADIETRSEESRAAVQEFTNLLKGELHKALRSGGPVNAIQVCHAKAPEIARAISERKGWKVGRTGLKYRNQSNAPDSWERGVLTGFEDRKKRGEAVHHMEFSEITVENGKRLFRYMKAIPTGGLCVICHGERIDPTVAAKLKELYPEDKAVGFEPGDIRGAFTITQPLK